MYMNKLSSRRVGLAVGLTAAGVHALWAFLMAVMPEQVGRFLAWDMQVHFVSMPFQILPFALGTAVELVLLAFVVGFGIGALFACAYNWATNRL